MPNKYATLADLFTATADAIRFKKGNNIEIIADEFPYAISTINNINKNTFEFTIPKGRITGDMDGDGLITEADADLARLLASLIEPDEIQVAIGDLDEDGRITALDANIIRKLAVGTITSWNMTDYYGNWVYVAQEGTLGYFYHDVSVPGVNASTSVTLVPSKYESWFIGTECLDGVVRIKVTNCPVEDCKGCFFWDKTETVVPEINLQSKTVTPSEVQQIITPDDGYDGLFEVVVTAVSVENLPIHYITVIQDGRTSVTLNGSSVNNGVYTFSQGQSVQVKAWYSSDSDLYDIRTTVTTVSTGVEQDIDDTEFTLTMDNNYIIEAVSVYGGHA